MQRAQNQNNRTLGEISRFPTRPAHVLRSPKTSEHWAPAVENAHVRRIFMLRFLRNFKEIGPRNIRCSIVDPTLTSIQKPKLDGSVDERNEENEARDDPLRFSSAGAHCTHTHLQVSAAVAQVGDPEKVWQRNIQTTRKLGVEALRRGVEACLREDGAGENQR